MSNAVFGDLLSIAFCHNKNADVILFGDSYSAFTSIRPENTMSEVISWYNTFEEKDFFGFIVISSEKNKAFNTYFINENVSNKITALSLVKDYADNRMIEKNRNDYFPRFKTFQHSSSHTSNTNCASEIIDISKNMDTSICFDIIGKTIRLYRNRFGKGNVYYSIDKECFLFCDKLKPLQEINSNKYTVNYTHWCRVIVNEKLAAGITNETIYQNIYQIMPGETITIKNLKLTKTTEQQIPIKSNNNSLLENASLLKNNFISSFEQCIAKSPLFGISLSGGLDSACIVSAGNLLHHKAIKTYSVAFDNNPSKDIDYINLINGFYKCESNVITGADIDFYQISDSILEVTEHPFYDSGAIGHYLVLQKAAETGITTLLDGEGAEVAVGPDDIVDFFPYYNSLLFKLKWINFLKNYSFYTSYGLKIWAKILLKSKLCLLQSDAIQWLNPDFYKSYKFRDDHLAIYYKKYKIYAEDAIKLDFIPFAMHCKCKLADNLGINYQFPFINETLLSFALGIPEKQKIKPPYTKYILRKAFEKELPAEVFQRKDKMAYSGPNLASFLRCGGKYYKTTLDIIKNSQLCQQKILLWDKIQADLYPCISVRLLSLCRMFDLFTRHGCNSKNW